MSPFAAAGQNLPLALGVSKYPAANDDSLFPRISSTEDPCEQRLETKCVEVQNSGKLELVFKLLLVLRLELFCL